MIRKVLLAVILVPVAVVIVALAVANRQAVTVSYDPLGGSDSALAVSLPLFLVILLSLIAGVILGGFAAWLRQSKWRKAARQREHEAERLRREAAELRRSAEDLRRSAEETRSARLAPPPGPAAPVS